MTNTQIEVLTSAIRLLIKVIQMELVSTNHGFNPSSNREALINALDKITESSTKGLGDE